MKKVSINGEEFYIKPTTATVKMIEEAQKELAEVEVRPQSNLIEKYSYKSWCELIAFFINCDRLVVEPHRQLMTADDVFSSNSHGELFGVIQAVKFVSQFVEGKFESEELNKLLISILEGQEVTPDNKYCSGIGLKCITFLFRCTEEYEREVNKILAYTFDLND